MAEVELWVEPGVETALLLVLVKVILKKTHIKSIIPGLKSSLQVVENFKNLPAASLSILFRSSSYAFIAASSILANSLDIRSSCFAFCWLFFLICTKKLRTRVATIQWGGSCRISVVHLCLISHASPDTAAKCTPKYVINPDKFLYMQVKLWPNVIFWFNTYFWRKECVWRVK